MGKTFRSGIYALPLRATRTNHSLRTVVDTAAKLPGLHGAIQKGPFWGGLRDVAASAHTESGAIAFVGLQQGGGFGVWVAQAGDVQSWKMLPLVLNGSLLAFGNGADPSVEPVQAVGDAPQVDVVPQPSDDVYAVGCFYAASQNNSAIFFWLASTRKQIINLVPVVTTHSHEFTAFSACAVSATSNGNLFGKQIFTEVAFVGRTGDGSPGVWLASLAASNGSASRRSDLKTIATAGQKAPGGSLFTDFLSVAVRKGRVVFLASLADSGRGLFMMCESGHLHQLVSTSAGADRTHPFWRFSYLEFSGGGAFDGQLLGFYAVGGPAVAGMEERLPGLWAANVTRCCS
eukprot:SAG31_NODE_5000_length_2808_cov_1.730897_1_plen_345_part_00